MLQASFVRAWQALRAGTDVRDLRPWLYRIAHNQALNTLRAAGSALPAVAAELPAISLEAEVERREELRAALHGIEALPDRQRAALVAIAVADRPHADVARELGMSDGALRQLLLRARTTLRAAATALTPYPLMSWLAGGQEATAARVAEVAVGAGGAGVAIKASAACSPRERSWPAAPRCAATTSRRARRPRPPRPRPIASRAARRVAAFTGRAPTADHQAGDQGGAAADHAARTPPRPAARRAATRATATAATARPRTARARAARVERLGLGLGRAPAASAPADRARASPAVRARATARAPADSRARPARRLGREAPGTERRPARATRPAPVAGDDGAGAPRHDRAVAVQLGRGSGSSGSGRRGSTSGSGGDGSGGD